MDLHQAKNLFCTMVEACIPGDTPAEAIQRHAIKCILERGLAHDAPAEHFCQKPVQLGQVGAALLDALKRDPELLQHKKKLSRVLAPLEDLGLVTVFSNNTVIVCLDALCPWLPAFIRDADEECSGSEGTGCSGEDAGCSGSEDAGCYGSEDAGCGSEHDAGQLEDMYFRLDKASFAGSGTLSNLRFWLTSFKIHRMFKGAHATLRAYVVGSALRAGLQCLGDGNFVQRAVPLADVDAGFTAAIAAQSSTVRRSILAGYDSFGRSLEAVLRDPQCAAVVHLQTWHGIPHVLVAVDKLVGQGFTPNRPSADVEEAKLLPLSPGLQARRIHSSSSSLPASSSVPAVPALNGSSSANAAAAQTFAVGKAVAEGIAAAKAAAAAALARPTPGSGSSSSTCASPLSSLPAAEPTVPLSSSFPLSGMPRPCVGGSASCASPSAQQSSRTTIITTLEQAREAVNWLRKQGAVGMSAEGEVGRKGQICLVQMYGAGRAFMFDLHSMQPAVCQDVVGLLGEELLGDSRVVKVLHDSRKVCEAFFYQYGIQIQAVWDTQVAFGVIQLLHSMTGEEAQLGLVALNSLLECYRLPINELRKWKQKQMANQRDLWTKRPLLADAIRYAVADVAGLVDLKERMGSQLGTDGSRTVARLSKAYSEWFFENDDRSYQTPPGSYASAVKLPPGCDMQMQINAANGYRPRFSVALSPMQPEKLPASAAVEQLERPCSTGEGAATSGAGPHGEEEEDGALDAAAEGMMHLFPPRIQAAIMQLCQGSLQQQAGEPAASPASTAAPDGGRVVGMRRRQPMEVIVDLGRLVTVRFDDGSEEDLEDGLAVQEALQCLAEAKGRADCGGRDGRDLFYGDNRTGIPGTLHRISAMRGREGEVLGMTYRIGRHVSGVALLVLDILAALSVGHPHADATGKPSADDFISPSLLLLGPPGVGKTTLLRDVANMMADTFRKRVVVVDTSNEIAGDAPTPHACIGRARRMMVPDRSQQHSVLIEAVQNHTPQVVVVDEIGSYKEAAATKSIGQRGVIMVGTAHGTSLETLLKNPELNSLVGGVHQVVLGDEEARRTNAGGKTRTERCGAPTFSTIVELLSYNQWRVHMNVARSVDAILSGREAVTQLRWYDGEGRMMVRVEGMPDSGLAKKVLEGVRGQQGGRGAWLHDLINLAAMY